MQIIQPASAPPVPRGMDTERPVILGAVGNDRHGEHVVAVALQLAAAHALRPVFVHVVGHYLPNPVRWQAGTPYVEAPDPSLNARHAEDAFAGWRRAAGIFRQAHVPSGADTYVLGGHPPTWEIRDLARVLPAAMAVVGGGDRRGRLRRVLDGSTAYALARSAPTPVLFVNDGKLDMNGTVVCGIKDADPASMAAASSAAALARRGDQRLVLAHVTKHGNDAAVGDLPAADFRLRAVTQTIAGEDVERVVVEGPVVPELAQLANRRGADLLVVGSNHVSPLIALARGCPSVDLLRRYRGPLLVVPSGSRPAS
jgi:nucleotide-binding universal stress UspA family protein